MLSADDWSNRYQQQAGWTRSLRYFLFQKYSLTDACRILEVGCGTGAVTSDFSAGTASAVFGFDQNYSFLSRAHAQDLKTIFTCGNGMNLPYADEIFDAVYCHFFLLWIQDVPSILAEMRRVTRKGGYILALAEPDYGGRIDFPPTLAKLGRWQATALKNQGADPSIGRRLMSEFAHVGLQQVESGLMGGQWNPGFDRLAFEAEWKIIESDLSGFISPSILQNVHQIDEHAHLNGERILFVPTFFAVGKNPTGE